MTSINMPITSHQTGSSRPANNFSSVSAFGHPIRFILLTMMMLLLVMIPGVASGQIVTATLQGTAQDGSGAVIPGASVAVENTSTHVLNHATTDASGRFTFPSLAPGGPYSITVQAAGFKTIVRAGITLEVSQSVDVPIALEIGTAEQKVEVFAEANQVETTTASVGQVISNNSVENLPLNQRNVYSLVFLSPGVTGTVGVNYNTFNMSINGGRPGTTDVLVDGIPASPQLIVPIAGFAVFPSVDATQEFKVESSQYSAQLGRSTSGIINIILKSGTNAFHGSVYDFVRNSVMDSNLYFNKRNNKPLPNFSRNQFGGSLSGPVRIPKLYNGKDRTFFLFSYEGLRQGTAAQITTTVPTARERTGDFSQTLNSAGQPVAIYDPATTTASGSGYVRSTFQGNVIPAARIDSVAAKIINYYPLPTQTGTNGSDVNNFFGTGTAQVSIDTIDTKVDQVFNERNRMFVRYSRRNLTQPPAYLFPGAGPRLAEGLANQPQLSNSAAVDYTKTFGQGFLVDIRYGFSRTALNWTTSSDGFNPTTQLGMPSYIASNADHLLFPGVAPANYYTLGSGANGAAKHGGFDVHLLGIDNSLVRGKHLMRFGGDTRLLRSNDNESGSSTGSFNFTNGITQGPNPNAATSTAGNAIASLLLGVGSTGQMFIGQKNVAVQSKYFGLYFQDDWKVAPKLTLNLGIRYDVDIPRTERFNRMDIFDATVTSPLAATTGITNLKGGVEFPGVNGMSRNQFPTRWTDVGPRFGFAYQLDNMTSIRGGYGIYYGPSMRSSYAGTGTEGFSSSTSYVGSLDGLTPSTYLSNPFPGGVNLPTGSTQGLVTGIGTTFENPLKGDNKVPYMQTWSLDVQRQLPFAILAEAAYVGSHGVQLNKSGENDWNGNQLSTASLALGTQLQTKVTNPFYGIIKTGPESGATIPQSYLQAGFPQYTVLYLSYLGGGSERFDSFQLKIQKRVTQGLSMLISFTGQKQIDDYSGIQNVGNITGGIQDIHNRKVERAVSSNDISRSLVANVVYVLPFGKEQRFGRQWNRPLDLLLGGWQINGITTQQTGFPLSPTTQDTSQSGGTTLRPNLTGTNPVVSGSVKSRLTNYLNSAAFSQPAAFTFGNAPRTLSNVRAQGTHNIDFSVFKNFKATESIQLQFRAEAFNVLNQVVFGSPNTVLSSGQFGVITTQNNNPRDIQLALKAIF